MSLEVDSGNRRGHSRSVSRSSRRGDEPSRESTYIYPEEDLKDRRRSRSRSDVGPFASGGNGLPYPSEGDLSDMLPGSSSLYSYDNYEPIYSPPPVPPAGPPPHPTSSTHNIPGAFPSSDPKAPRIENVERRESKREKKSKDADDGRRPRRPSDPRSDDDKFKFLPQKYSHSSDTESKSRDKDKRGKADSDRFSFLPQKYSSKAEDEGRKRASSRSSRSSRSGDEGRDRPSAKAEDNVRNRYSFKSEAGGRDRYTTGSPEDEGRKRHTTKPSEDNRYMAKPEIDGRSRSRSVNETRNPQSPRSPVESLQKISQTYLAHPGQSVETYLSDRKERHKKKAEQLEDDLAYGRIPPDGRPPRQGKQPQDAPPTYAPPSHAPPGYGPTGSAPPHGPYGGDRPASTLAPAPAPAPVYDEYGRLRAASPAVSQTDSRRTHRYSQSHQWDDPRGSRQDMLGPERPKSRDRERDDARGSRQDILGAERPKSRDRERDDPRGSRQDLLGVERPKSRDRERSRDRRRDKSQDHSLLMVGTSSHHRSKSRDKSKDRSRDRSSDRSRDKSRDRRHSHGHRDKSPHHRPSSRLSNLGGTLAVGGAAAALGAPSPMLESYRGTYQDCSPMPSPLLLPTGQPGEVEPLSPISDSDAEGKKRNRRARFHSTEDNASRLAAALRGNSPPDREPLIEILPSLTHEQVMELRIEYKNLVKTGAHRKGVNIAKHIRARLKDDNPNLMKACYAVALGKWESEAYWANFWYQGDKTRRELLIESLMGRTNDEIREIKYSFNDKKYDDSLIKCMKEELKEDKFKKAVMMVLEERRMDEYDSHGHKIPLDMRLVQDDVDDLRRAIKSDKGGETAMLTIVVLRSDSHLREIMKEYDHVYRSNFARDALKKSGNLVGEVLAHILNGAINRPVRDALLLHHALTASRKDELRHELLTSRLVRLHWDGSHMSAVRHAYRSRYGRSLQDAVREATSGHWGSFCEELCIARVPNDVRRFEKVSLVSR